MHKRNSKAVIASMIAAAMTASAVISTAAPMQVSANEILGESTFDYKILPWHLVEASPARQDIAIVDGALFIEIIIPEGAEKSKWDLKLEHNKLSFEEGKTYEISFDVKTNRAGMELSSHIGEIGGDYEQYFVLDGHTGDMHQGPHMGGMWGQVVKLDAEWQTFSGTFKPTRDLENVQWVFEYAQDYNGYGGNAQRGDELWFDNISINCIDGSDAIADYPLGYVNRDNSGLKNNFISVNQLGYFPNRTKIATLGDNTGDPFSYASKINLTGSYQFEIVDTASGKVVYTGKTGETTFDHDSMDNICKIDFTDFSTPGTYYIRIKGKEWRSFPFRIADNLYQEEGHNLLTDAVNYFYQNRAGVDIEADYISSGEKSELAHVGGHKSEKATVQTKWQNEYLAKEEALETYASSEIEVSGGWYSAFNHAKQMVEGGYAVWMLQNMYERNQMEFKNKDIFDDNSGTVLNPETDNNIPDILDECKYELDFMEKMKVTEDEPTCGKYAGLYYHKVQDQKPTGLAIKPWDYDHEWGTVRIVKPPTFAATLNYAACAAQAARLWMKYDSDYAEKLMQSAKDAYQAFRYNYYEAAPDEENDRVSLYAPKYQARGGDPFGDHEVRDDAYWAACELYISAKEMEDESADEYLGYLSDYQNAFEVTDHITGGENSNGNGTYTMLNWGNTTAAGTLSLALHGRLLTADQREKLEKSILAVADKYVETTENQGYGIPYLYDGPAYSDYSGFPDIIITGYEYGSNGMVANNMIAMAYAYDLSHKTKYLNGVLSGMNYLLGNNPLSFSFITGYGSYHEQNPTHRYWAKEMDDKLPSAPDGVLCSGPNVGLQDPYVRMGGFVRGKEDNPSQRCFMDSVEAWSVNEAGLQWNAPLAWLAAFLQDCEPLPASDPKITQPENGTTTTQKDTAGTLWGDSTCDGAIDVADAVLLARYLVQDQEASITDQGLTNANVIKGTLNQEDLSAILLYIARYIKAEQFPLDKLPDVSRKS